MTVEISESLEAALHALARASAAAEAAPSDRQVARRAIEQASVVARIARSEGFGRDRPPGHVEDDDLRGVRG